MMSTGRITSALSLRSRSASSQATFLRSEQVLKRSCASGWKTEKTVVSFTDIVISAICECYTSNLGKEVQERTSKNDTGNPTLFLRCRAGVDALENERLSFPGDSSASVSVLYHIKNMSYWFLLFKDSSSRISFSC